MARRYAPDHKRLVMKIMVDFRLDLEKTAHYTGIPVRTLNDWRKEIQRNMAKAREAAARNQSNRTAAANTPLPAKGVTSQR
jgi:phosphoenolpyruvate carboxylase